MSHSDQLAALRQHMRQYDLDYYFVPARDAHNNEYVPTAWQRRAFITGFTGSAGDALIGQEAAYLWTDGRYFLQAEQELDPTCFTLMKQQPGTPSLPDWLRDNIQGQRLGVDPRLISIQQAQRFADILSENDSTLVCLEDNLVDAIWTNQPPLSSHPIHLHDLAFAGVPAHEKIASLQTALHAHQVDAHVITALDAIAWLFNIRGTDIPFNPLAICYAIVTNETATLFIDPDKYTACADYFAAEKIHCKPYADFKNALQTLTGAVWIDPNTTSQWVAQHLTQAHMYCEDSPITHMKAIKNKTEQHGMREAHRRDALALVRFFAWLEANWSGQTEQSIADQLEQIRRSDPHCVDLSFETISGFGPNGAVIHYRVTPETNRAIDQTALLLIDSGGQYYEGTTDVTRTIHLGTPTPTEKTHYTLVLKGHCALRHAVFPAGTCGEHLDVLARQPLWRAGLDFAHGTGHGVGCYLCVHEGPQRISRVNSNVALEPGMVLSNEPGVYFKGQYGIRIENVCLVTAIDEKRYTFEDLTLVPYARNLIDTQLLSSEEIDWINAYHHTIYQTLSPDLPTSAREWLQTATAPL